MRFKLWIYVGIFAAFAVYTSWMLGPFLRSTIIRDAAVTTWSNFAVSPINGRIASDLPVAGTVLGEDGQVVLVRNDLLLDENRAVRRTRAEIVRSEAAIVQAEKYLDSLQRLERQRRQAKALNTEVFKAQLHGQVKRIEKHLDLIGRRIEEVEQEFADNLSGDVTTGSLEATLSPLLHQREELNADLALLKLRQRNAMHGVFMMSDGEMPHWAHEDQFVLAQEIARVSREIERSRVARDNAVLDLADEERILKQLSSASVAVPPNSIVFATPSSRGATVTAGERIVEWIDCDDLLIDVPVSDAELPLVRPGDRAMVIIEGETVERSGLVELARGSAAVLGRLDIVALAKGRTPGRGQVILKLDPDGPAFDECPIGLAAYVEFPNIGIINVIRARLRL